MNLSWKCTTFPRHQKKERRGTSNCLFVGGSGGLEFRYPKDVHFIWRSFRAILIKISILHLSLLFPLASSPFSLTSLHKQKYMRKYPEMPWPGSTYRHKKWSTKGRRDESNLSSSNTDGSFTMAYSNSFFSPCGILPIAQENKYLEKFSYFIM